MMHFFLVYKARRSAIEFRLTRLIILSLRVRKMVRVILACRQSFFIKRSQFLSLGLLLVGTLLGCTAHICTPLQPEINTRVERKSRPHILPYQKGPVPFENSIIQKDPKLPYQLRHLKIPSIGENGQENNLIEALYYRSNTAGKLPLVIVLPIWGQGFGVTYPPEKVTSTLRSRSHGGMHVLRVLGEREVIDWKELGEAESEEQFLSIMSRMAQREATHIIDASRLVDWAEERDEIDATRIGLIGFSHSAITGSMMAANEPRFAAVVLMMGGAHPHRILAVCDSDAARLREKILPRFGWTAGDYERAIEPFFRPVDVANYPGRVDPSRILIFDSHVDQCVPRDSRDDLWEALGRPERISFLYGHKMSFLTMTPLGFYWTRREIYEFFESTLFSTVP